MAMNDRNEDLLLEGGIQFHEIWEMVKKRRMILYYFTGFVFLASLIRVSMQTPIYQAYGTLLIEKEGSGQMNLLNQYYVDSDWRGDYINTQIRVLTSRSLARKVVEELNLLPGMQKSQPAKEKSSLQRLFQGSSPPDGNLQISRAVDGFLGGLGVANIAETRLLQVTYISPDPNLAARSINALFDKFIEFNLEMKNESTKQASEFLTAQIEDMRRSLSQKERELQEYGKRKELFFLRGEDSTVVQKLGDLNNAYTDAQIERINKESTYRELKETSYENYSDVRNNPLIQNMKLEYSSKETEYKKKSQIFQDSYPEMQRLKSQMESLRKRIDEETAEVARKALNQAAAEYQAAMKKENGMSGLLGEQKGSVVSTNANAIYYNSLKIEVQNMTNLLDYLVRKQKESLLTSRLEGLQTSNIKIVDRAEIPRFPIAPNKQRTLMMALMMGLGGGIFLIFALNFLDNTLKTPEEVEKFLHIPALGFVPAVGSKASQSYYYHYYSDKKKEKDEQRIKTIELANLKDPESSYAEYYRNIRTSLLLSTPERPPQLMVLTSALPQEGKTVTSVNLAISFIQLGKKVLLVDCDLRRPRIHKIFRLKNTAGISSFLVGRCQLEEAIQRSPLEPNLHVITSGPIPPNPLELINSKAMADLVALLRKHYDFIIVDAPPLMGITDGILLGKNADGLIIVALGGKTSRKVIEKTIKEIEKYGIKVIGLILNNINLRKLSYSYYSYQYKYGEYKVGEERRPDA